MLVHVQAYPPCVIWHGQIAIYWRGWGEGVRLVPAISNNQLIWQAGKAQAFAMGFLFLVVASVAWVAHATQQAALTQVAANTQSDVNGPVIPPAAKGDQCVADTALMRTDHMDLLNHQRDETVIEGIRNKPFSLVGCVNCHAQTTTEGAPIRIDAEGQFCQSCHAYAAVKIDCFTCHAAVPEQLSEPSQDQSASWFPDKTQPHSMLANNEISFRLNVDQSDRGVRQK